MQLFFILGAMGLTPTEYDHSVMLMSLIAFIVSVLATGFLALLFERTAISMWQRDQLASEMSKLRDSLMGIVGHQFRTPLSIIRWNNEIPLSDNTLTPDQRQLVQENTPRENYCF